MTRKPKDPKEHRITVRISDADRAKLESEAEKQQVTVGAVVRKLIRERLQPPVTS